MIFIEEARVVRDNLFIGLRPPTEWVSALCETQERLRSRGLRGLIWKEPECIHLSLMSLDRADWRQIGGITEAMEQAGEDCEPFELEAGALDVFGPTHQPTFLWAGVRGEVDRLDELRRALTLRLRRKGRSYRRRLVYHITLARVRQPVDEALSVSLGGVLARTVLPPVTPYAVRRIWLIHRSLAAGVVQHHPIASAAVGIMEKGC